MRPAFMRRPLLAVVAMAFAIGSAMLAAVFLFAAIDSLAGQDAPIWLALGISAALAAAVAVQSCIVRLSLGIRGIVLRASLCLVLASPAALLLSLLSSYPP